jgi:ATP-dependent RNA helicase RhlE
LNFTDFNLDERLLAGLDSMGFQKATPIQEQAIPLILEGKDIIACAQTGTGKTAAYILPVINQIGRSETTALSTLVLAPTRELVGQIDQQIEGFAYFISVSSVPVYGGGDGATWEMQKKAINSGTDILVATPGRLLALLTSGAVNLKGIQFLILDEADRMLDMGFYEDIMRIISYLPKKRQALMFSATMPPKIRKMAQEILDHPVEISIAISKPAEKIIQQAYLTYDQQKTQLLKRLFKNSSYNSVIIFCSTKEGAKNLEKEMKKLGNMKFSAFHSDLEQKEREAVMRDFKNRELQVLIGTDILSRGIDVEGIDLVINYDVPPDPEDYIHRIGRTARADSNGMAITFISQKDQAKFKSIEALIEKDIPKFHPPAEIGPGPEYHPGKSDRPSFHRRKKR